ncbi:nucleotidyltransferase [Halalkalibacillus halophilus]|uniref:nucleotidyltransferase n=1 Tax=Halalkalibacillus halophilus TaxID=392827 RepID=UPI0004100FF5|nr:nucleotidyltransferase [Halalkalibacillus halophilus]
MRACGVVVEYNPFHNGHLYHVTQSKEETNADITVAVMSGNFLQRGEPAIIDKFSRTRAALKNGVDLVIELPYLYAVQSADLFAHGSIAVLQALNVDTVCFGSESGKIDPFMKGYLHFKEHENKFQSILHRYLDEGFSFPKASTYAYESIGLTEGELDLSQPNNILGFSYVKAAKELNASMDIHTIKRTENHYHDQHIDTSIASATSIRKEIIQENMITSKANAALPPATIEVLENYLTQNGKWHAFETYFDFLQYLVQIKSVQELRLYHGMIEGLEYRLKETSKTATTFEHWMQLLKTKRYTWTRLQRMFIHLLTHTTKEDMDTYIGELLPYVRILGMNNQGRSFINQQKRN